MLSTILILFIMLLILLCLGSGLHLLVKDKGQSIRTVKALSFRIGLSLILFLLLFLLFRVGWISPHNV